jgi:hypothetical protein
MINLIVIAISVLMLALLLIWWRWPALRVRMEAPKYSMICQERRFDDQQKGTRAGNQLERAPDR